MSTRAVIRLTHHTDDTGRLFVVMKIDYAEWDGSKIGAVVHTEEFNISANVMDEGGFGYISEVVSHGYDVVSGTSWIRPDGVQHDFRGS
jgi:hypothetical protein